MKNMFGENIRTFREDQKWSQQKFADKLSARLRAYGKRDAEYSSKSISKWENGDGMPSMEIVFVLSEMLSVKIDDLLKTQSETFYKEYGVESDFSSEKYHWAADNRWLISAIDNIYDYDVRVKAFKSVYYDSWMINRFNSMHGLGQTGSQHTYSLPADKVNLTSPDYVKNFTKNDEKSQIYFNQMEEFSDYFNVDYLEKKFDYNYNKDLLIIEEEEEKEDGSFSISEWKENCYPYKSLEEIVPEYADKMKDFVNFPLKFKEKLFFKGIDSGLKVTETTAIRDYEAEKKYDKMQTVFIHVKYEIDILLSIEEIAKIKALQMKRDVLQSLKKTKAVAGFNDIGLDD